MSKELRGQLDIFGGEQDGGEDYRKFVAKFDPENEPKTTDDCYTPENVYDAVAGWVSEEYGVRREDMVRPFWQGADYKAGEYDGRVVVDNPPFSILVEIKRWFAARGVKFFLFAPTLTLFSGAGLDECYMPCGVQVTYANGAVVNSSFVTNLDRARVRTVPGLYRAVKAANDANERASGRSRPKYSYPVELLTAAAAYQYSRLGVDFEVMPEECVKVGTLDHMRGTGKAIFGGGYLLSEAAAARRAAAERAAAERAVRVWELSEREREIVRRLK